jgi:beta-glucanase (GH16 family)
MVYGTIHTKKYNGLLGTQKSDSILIEDAHTNFHTYSIEWTDKNITWMVDDQAYQTLEKGTDDINGWPFNQFDYHLILNLAVGGDWGGKYGVDEDIWPQKLTIDYVRYYKMKEE